MLRATLQYPANPEAKGSKLVQDVDFFCKSSENISHLSEVLFDTWLVILDIVRCVPPGHEWQESLIQAVDGLRRRDCVILEQDDVRDLPNPKSNNTFH